MTYLSLEVSAINLPLKNKQPSILKDTERVQVGCFMSVRLLLIHNSWLHSIITQMDMFLWPVTSG